ncbi:MAG: class I SAM-dependent methyltransferase [Actinobacteria bacterium]|nr:class I SAM-dependent methyltransferase [Actinomycetota bacterium]
MGPAAAHWKRHLEAWAIPADLLAAAEEPPYGWPPAVLARMRRERDRGAATPTIDIVTGLAPDEGTVLDVGAGTGRLAVPLARAGHRVTAVEPAATMLAGLREGAAGLPVEVVEGRWPEAAGVVGRHDVAVSAHVVYDVADLAPFLAALADRAAAVVIECGADHPWASLAPLYRALHGLERPAGPTVDDLAAVVEEITGAAPEVERWEAARPLWFADEPEMLAFYRRRLVLPADRTPELAALLAPRVRRFGGGVTLDDRPRQTATVWWRA